MVFVDVWMRCQVCAAHDEEGNKGGGGSLAAGSEALEPGPFTCDGLLILAAIRLLRMNKSVTRSFAPDVMMCCLRPAAAAAAGAEECSTT